MKNYALSADAAQDLLDILDYIAKDSPGTALRVVEEIEGAMAELAEYPGMGHVREDLTHASLRFWPIYSWLVIYQPVTHPLVIVRILRGQQDVEKILRNL